VLVLLKRCIADSDDEVRDRATFYTTLLEKLPAAAVSKYMLNAPPVSAVALERALTTYVQTPSAAPFDLRLVPLEAASPSGPPPTASDKQDFLAPSAASAASVAAAAGSTAALVDTGAVNPIVAAQLAAVPQFTAFGPLLKSTPAGV
jgi:coatomer protein complex subunit gamma